MHSFWIFLKGDDIILNPEIETERLILRPIALSDAEDAFIWNSDPRVMEFLSHPTYTDINQTISWIKSTSTDKNKWTWAFILKEENKAIGSGSITISTKVEGSCTLGYCLNYNHWHKGYCTEATKAMIGFAKTLGVKEICAEHAIDNPRSGKVMEKCGLKFDHYGEYKALDESKIFKSKCYKLTL